MTQIRIRHLVILPGARGALPRYFWQPSSKLRALGWRPTRVPADWPNILDPGALEAAAIAAAQDLNAKVDASREALIDAAALASVRPPPPLSARTLHELIVDYKQGRSWRELAPKSQRGYNQCLARLEVWGGDVPVRVITAARVQKLIDSLRATPAVANAVARVLRLLLEHGRRGGWITINPALRPNLTGTPPTGLIWPRGAVDVFVAAADRLGRHSIGTAVLLNEWLGQREGDILRMPRQAFRNGSLVLKQSKTGAGVVLPIHLVERLMQRYRQEEARQQTRVGLDQPLPFTIVVNETTGLPYKEDNFRHLFAEVRAAAALDAPAGFNVDHLMPGRSASDPNAFVVRMEQLTFMSLRHTAVTRLAEAGADNSLIATITGHSQATVQSIIERYMVRTAKMAALAFGKRVAAEEADRAPPKSEAENIA
ncbi:Integrase, catalytic domain containing protein [uncultured Caudovirales phage]|uniref:Integrase, catalytic domain containing protein n=1 Tax=uncultured Caudovirales phage TaxID=2100421 RepID=A0A6J5PAU6_9CAUD|nr:Integrase, catalytic domain containing protein [uncultured Caudovirales phage]CAB4172417.1 Integrase, catalytic domain containing protein [uncultured Caudovirales phage]